MSSITLSYTQTSEKCTSGFSNKVTDNLGKNQFCNWNAFIDGEEKKLKEVIRWFFSKNHSVKQSSQRRSSRKIP